MEVAVIPVVVLLIFHLYLLVRWEKVKRANMFLIGLAGLLLTFIGNFFMIRGGAPTVAAVFYCVGALGAFLGAVGACYPGELPRVESVQRPAPAAGPKPAEGPSQET